MTAEEKEKAKADSIKSFEDFKVPDEIKDQVEVPNPDLLVFAWHGQRIDLRKLTPQQMLKYAANPTFPNLRLTKKAQKAAEAEKTEKEPSPSGSTNTPKDEKGTGGKKPS